MFSPSSIGRYFLSASAMKSVNQIMTGVTEIARQGGETETGACGLSHCHERVGAESHIRVWQSRPHPLRDRRVAQAVVQRDPLLLREIVDLVALA
jgi:hypothetical protein